MEPAWTADWIWALPLTAVTTVVHVSAIIGIAALLLRVRARIEKHPLGRGALVLYAIGAFGSVGVALAALNGLDVAIWAAAYLGLHAIDSPADAMLYSMNAMTAFGSSGMELQRHWKLMGALEAANGLLVFGISTAFLASFITEWWTWFPKLLQQKR